MSTMNSPQNTEDKIDKTYINGERLATELLDDQDPIALSDATGNMIAQNISFGLAQNSGESLIDNSLMPTQQELVHLPMIKSGGRFKQTSGQSFFDQTQNDNMPGSRKFNAKDTTKIVE